MSKPGHIASETPGEQTPDPMGSGDGFRVAGWDVIPSTNRVHKGHRVLKLEPKVMDLLVYLASRQGRVVTRKDMEQAVWTGTVVGYDTPNAAIRKLRKALGDDPRNPHIIETLSKRGYRLIAEVKPLPADGPSPTSEQEPRPDGAKGLGFQLLRVGILLAFAAALAGFVYLRLQPQPGEPSAGRSVYSTTLAVLPLENLSADPSQSTIADGLTDSLSTNLSKIPGLRVIARESTFVYAEDHLDVGRIGSDLGARFLIHGNVLRSGDQIRVNLHLVDSEDGAHLWAEHFDGLWTQILPLQDRINRDAVSAIAPYLSTGATDSASGP